jgi:sterol O-acyltransferase
MDAQKKPADASSFGGTSHLIAELNADGTASLQHDNLSRTSGSSQNSSASSASSEGSIHGELDGLVPASTPESESAVSPRNHYHSSKEPYGNKNISRLASRRRKSLTVRLEKTDEAGRYHLTAEDPELRELLKQGFERSKDGGIKKKRSRFRDLVFTRQFTAFDRQNSESASSPFHGFFSLFWFVVGGGQNRLLDAG